MQPLKLIALDTEDLAAISAQMQDAVMRVGDLVYHRKALRFVAGANRFNWLDAIKQNDRDKGAFERRQCALRFERVRGVQVQGIDLADKRRVLSMLATEFEPRTENAPDGAITLYFAGSAAIRLDVECIECELRDLGAAWATQSRPDHSAADSVSGAPDEPEENS